MLYGWLLDKNSYRCEPLTDLSYPVVLLQGRESGGDRFIESFRGDLYGVLNVSKILYRNCASSESHKQKRSIFAFCSPTRFPVFVSTNVSVQAPLQYLGRERKSRMNDAEVKSTKGNYIPA